MPASEIVRTGTVIEFVDRGMPGKEGPPGPAGKGALLLEATAVIPDDIPPDTPIGTIIYQKNA
jgi:hypothetical protein